MGCAAAMALQAGTASGASSPAHGLDHWPHHSKSCDPARFDGAPHFAKVRLNHGAIASVHLIRTEDGDEVVTSHPYGTVVATVWQRERCMSLERLAPFVARVERRQRFKARLQRRQRSAASPEAPGATPAPAYNTGLLIGWNDSTGQAPGQCYNFTTSAPTNNVGSLSFSSEGAASSVAAQTRVSATVSGGFGAFSASAKFSYSDQWQNSARSGRAYFNISSIWTLDNTVDSENPLTEQGANAGDQLATLCGVRYMGSVPAGMVATIAVAYGTNSETAKRNIDASFSVSDAGLGSLKAAVDASNATSDTSSHFKVQLNHIGGGTEATTELTTSFGAGNSDGPYYDQCGKGDADACATFIGNMTTAAINAGNDFNQRAQSIEAGEDLSFFTPFPNGAAGVDTTQLVTEPASTDDDVLAPYQDQLEQYMTLVNEIATLDNRAKHLSTLIAETPSFNPSNILDLQNYLGPLVDENPGAISYAASKTILLDDLSNCLNATSSDVTEVCSSIIEGGETVASAYDFYDAEHGYPDCTNATSSDDVADCWLAQQNTIALQYAATYDNGRHSWPEDVIYADVFPTFTASPPPFGSGVPISGKAGLIPFTDATFFDSGPGDPAKEQEFAVVNILPLKNDVDLSAIYESTDPSMLAFNIFGFDDDPTSPPVWSSSNLPFTWTSPICEPSFSAPCAIGYQLRAADETITVSINQVSDLFTAD